MKCEFYDVVVVGTGAAGLFAALHIPSDFSVLMITKDKLENSDSYLAQGGISCLLDAEDYDRYFQDTMTAGRNENKKEAVDIMIRQSKEIIQELMENGVDFDRNENGEISYTREGAHSTFRILHHKDETGKEITSKLIAAAKKRENIVIQEYTTMFDLLEEENRCLGILAERNGELIACQSKAVILATGGLGGLFASSTNFPHITGDSFAIALKHGIALENIHYIQIHPTVLYTKKTGRRFLISESVRGEGAVLLNEKGERFVNELLPRDVVTEAIRKEMEKFGTDHVYLSLVGMKKEEIMYRFPNIYRQCLEEGYDMAEVPIPVTPAQHYLMGGIQSTVNGESSMKNLYVVGESACNGVHGANRLASNSLLESLVFAKRAAKLIAEDLSRTDLKPVAVELPEHLEVKDLKAEYRTIVMNEIKRKDGEFYAKWCNNEN